MKINNRIKLIIFGVLAILLELICLIFIIREYWYNLSLACILTGVYIIINMTIIKIGYE